MVMDSPPSYGCNAARLFPHYGAIFMANTSTRDECFRRKLFGLPSSYANFVMKIKKGMILFLFDYQERKLHGVFEARSDGTLNISKYAYESSGRQFPAQVQFHILWRCIPIPEAIFRDAIKENYYAPYKFHFGLSKQQVWKLSCLFEKAKIASTGAILRLTLKRMVYKRPIKDSSDHRSQDHAKPRQDVSVVQHNNPAPPEPQGSIASDGLSLTSEDFAEQVCEDSAVKDASQDMVPCEPEDFIPLPSVDPAEIADIFPDGFADDWDLDLFADCGLDAENLDSIFDTSPFRFPFGESESLKQGESLQGANLKQGESSEQRESLEEGEILEDGESTSKHGSQPLGSLKSEEQLHNTQTHSTSIPTSECQVKGLYSDSEVRTSVFSRLKGASVESWNLKRTASIPSDRMGTMSSNLPGKIKGASVESWNVKRAASIPSDRVGSTSSYLSGKPKVTSEVSGKLKKMASISSDSTGTTSSNLSGKLNGKASISSRLTYPSRAASRKDQHYTSGGAVSQLMQRLENNHRRWDMDCKNGKQESRLQCNAVNWQRKRATVFSRLNRSTTMEVKAKPKDWASLVKDLDNFQRKFGQALHPAGSHECNIIVTEKTGGFETEEEAESVCVRTGTQESPKREQKRRRLDGQFSVIMSLDSNAPTRDCESSVQVPPEVNPEALETSGSCEGS